MPSIDAPRSRRREPPGSGWCWTCALSPPVARRAGRRRAWSLPV